MRKLCLLVFLLMMGGWSAQAQQTVTGTLTAAGTAPACLATECLFLPVTSTIGGVAITLSGTWSGTASFYGSGDGGSTLVALNVTPSSSTTPVSTATGNGSWQVNPSGYTGIYVIFTTASSGSVIATMHSATASARASGGGGGGGITFTCSTPDAFLYWLTSTTGACDSGITTNTSGQLSATGGLVATGDGTHAGIVSIPGNTTTPAIASNAFGFIGPNSASFTSWFIQPAATAPLANSVPILSAASSNIVSLTPSGSLKCAASGTGASPSVAACGADIVGSFSCATNASAATCVVDTSAVTANSAIFVQPSAAAGSLLSVTCNTTADTGLTAPRLASISAATSFTINLGTFSSNPLCFNFWIVN